MNRLVCALALLLTSGLLACKPAESPGSRLFLKDEQGRALILRGTNVESAAKSAVGHAISLTDSEIEFIARDMGFNAIRYLIFWDGVEPEPGQYDEAYLDQVVRDIGRFHAQGFHVLVDMHQDVYAARFCCDGAPEWAIRDDGASFSLQENWAFNYFQPAVQAAWDNFWAYDEGDHADLQDHYVAMWQHVARRLRDVPGVIGYDIMNEPHPGSAFDTLEVLARLDSTLSPDFDRERLGPFFQRAIDAIRKSDSERYIFFEPRYGSPGNGSPSWLEPLVDPRDGEPRIGYAPHLYSLELEKDGVYRADDETLPLWEKERRKELERQPMPFVLGEWGLAFGATDADVFVRELMEMGERMLMSWLHWSWDPGGPTSWALYDRATKTLNPMFAVVDRPYPRVVAGEPSEWRYDEKTQTFTFTWTELDRVEGESEFFIPFARAGGENIAVTLSDEGGQWSFRWDEGRPGLLHVKADARRKTHTLVVKPAE